MTKIKQEEINEVVLQAIKDFRVDSKVTPSVKRLRTCKAEVFTLDDYYVLKSYNTIVAFIDRKSDTLYDFLRYTYGYTVTSAQHIAEFNRDYGKGEYGCTRLYRWYPIARQVV